MEVGQGALLAAVFVVGTGIDMPNAANPRPANAITGELENIVFTEGGQA